MDNTPEKLKKELEEELQLSSEDLRSHAWYHGRIPRQVRPSWVFLSQAKLWAFIYRYRQVNTGVLQRLHEISNSIERNAFQCEKKTVSGIVYLICLGEK